MWTAERRLQRREFKDYQPLFMLISSLEVIDEGTRRAFMCINGPVWQRYNEATKGASQRRITVLFLSNEQNGFDALLFVGCDYVRRRQHHCSPLWFDHPMCADLGDDLIRRACIEWEGRSVLKIGMLTSALRPIAPGPTISLTSSPQRANSVPSIQFSGASHGVV